MADEETIAVLAPAVHVAITIEDGTDGDEIHLHAGGQGIWVARMLRELGHQPIACAPVGGETGRALLGLTAEWGIRLHIVDTLGRTRASVQDRRDGDGSELAHTTGPPLTRHECDELYGRFLELALDAGRAVVTGPEESSAVLEGMYRRLGADLATAGIEVVADLHGPALDAFLSGGPLRALKVSSGDLVEDGLLEEEQDEDDDAVRAVADDLAGRGVDVVVVSRGGAPTIALTPAGGYAVSGPSLQPVDTAGSGDSMTAALSSSLARGLVMEEALARAWAAGAANVARRGLGSGNAGLIEQLADRASVRPLR